MDNKTAIFSISFFLVFMAGCGTPYSYSVGNSYSNALNNAQASYQAGEISEAEYLQRRQEITAIEIAEAQIAANKKQAMFNAMIQNNQPADPNAGLYNAMKIREMSTGKRQRIYSSDGQYIGYSQEE